VLVVAIVAMTPAGYAGANDDWADQGVATGGTIDNSQDDYTGVHTDDASMHVLWGGGIDQDAGHTLEFTSSVASGSEFWNELPPELAAMIHGTVLSGDNDVVIFVTPAGLYVGGTAIIDVGTLVAVGGDVTPLDPADHPSVELSGVILNEGVIKASQDVLLYGSHVINAGEITTPAGQLLMLGADSIHFLDADTIAEGLLDPIDFVALLGQGTARNMGDLSAESAALIGRRVINTGHIEIADGTLMMLAGDAVHLRSFGDPVVVSLPRNGLESNRVESLQYAVENRGTIDAGRGHVRLAAADPLGWGIRQIASPGGETPATRAGSIEIAGSEKGRVEIAGRVDVSDREAGGVGGTIDVTGETIVLEGDVVDEAGTVLEAGATLDASGDAGGGTIRVGGEEKGQGDLQRARGLVVAEGSEVRADAITDGDGGRVILFAESLAHIAGDVSARGGALGGDGGFVETSGLQHLSLETTPDLSAPEGDAGDWLIDPFSITLVAEDAVGATDCETTGPCLNKAVEAILAPNFDSAGFDDILRTIDPAENPTIADTNSLSIALLVRALAVGTDITLSTEAFDPNGVDPAEALTRTGDGSITIQDSILIPNGDAAPGTRATLTLLAAGNINVDADILVGSGDPNVTPDMNLDLVFTANDQAQRDPNQDFGPDQTHGTVDIDANIRTGGGNVTARGITIDLDGGASIETDGGDVFFQTGSIDRFGNIGEFGAADNPVAPDIMGVGTGINIAGTIDTDRPTDDGLDGGSVTMQADSVNVRQLPMGGTTTTHIEAGRVDVGGSITTGGGNVAMRAGTRGSTSVGNVGFTGATVDTGGGSLTIDANRLSAEDPAVAIVDTVFATVADNEGGQIELSGANMITTAGGLAAIGSSHTQRVAIEGMLDTTGGNFGENGLLGIFAGDASGQDDALQAFGAGKIEIGGSVATTLQASGISLEARDVETLTSAGANSVAIVASGNSSLEFLDSDVGKNTDNALVDADFVTAGLLSVEAERQAVFERNTLLQANLVDLSIAEIATFLTDDERAGLDSQFMNPFLRLHFDGMGGVNAVDGVRIQADSVSIRTAATFDMTEDGTAPDPGTEDINFQRESFGDYRGLQLRSADGAFRPENVTIEQAKALNVVDDMATPMQDSQLFFGGRSGAGSTDGIFGDADIGVNHQNVTLTSFGGTLDVDDAAGLNDDTGAALRSRVTLNGGLVLDGSGPVDFLGIANAFEVEELTITSPGDLTIDEDAMSTFGALATGILSADELSFVAGRPTDLEDLGFDTSLLGGTLTVASGLTLTAADSLSLHGGANGFGDLVFDAPAPTATRLEANSISLRAGAGRDTQNLDPDDRSEIQGAADVEIRDAASAAFLADGTQKTFSFRQDAAIDAATHLPTLDDFGILAGGFGTTGERVDYSLRSDFGVIDLSTGGFDDTQVRDVDISLISTEVGGLPGILLPTGFVFDGRHVTLGGTTSFGYSQDLADAFAPAGVAAAADKQLTLRAGSNGVGFLTFGSGVVVRAPHIRLVATDGEEGDFGSTIVVAGASFDLSDGAANDRSFVFHEDEFFAVTDLPTESQFDVGMGPVLPSILAIRNDNGTIDWSDPDFTALPLELGDALDPGRLILEAENLILTANFDTDLVLTSDTGDLANLRLRLRTENLRLQAINGTGVEDGGRIVADERTGDTAGAISPTNDAGFDAEHLLVEGFEVDAEATTGNLSGLSETAPGSGVFDLATARGPRTITIIQDGDILPDSPTWPMPPMTPQPTSLIERFNIAGHLARSQEDDANGDPEPTDLFLQSTFGSIVVATDYVSGSDLIVGSAFLPEGSDFFFESGAYTFGDLTVLTEGDITLDDADITADLLQLEAGLLLDQPFVAIDGVGDNVMGQLVFDDSTGNSDLTANTLILRAGPTFRVTNPDTDGDGLGEDLDPAAQAAIDFSGLGMLTVRDGMRESSLTVSSTADLDTSDVLDGMAQGATEWDLVDLGSVQFETRVVDSVGGDTIGALGDHARRLILGSDETGATLEIVLNSAIADPFSAARFEGGVELRSNDILIDATDPGASVQLDLEDPNLRITSRSLLTGFEALSDLDVVSSEIDPEERSRPRLRVRDDDDFSSTLLPRLDRYFQRGFVFGSTTLVTQERDSLRFIEIGLEADDSDLVFTDDLRNGSIGSNLSLSLINRTMERELQLAVTQLRPGVGDYQFESLTDIDIRNNPALELASFEVTGFDSISIPAFDPDLAIAGNASPTVATNTDFGMHTLGDQLWDAKLSLGETADLLGRDLRFTGDIFRNTVMGMVAPLDVGLRIRTTGEVIFEDDIGVDGEPISDGDTPAARLGFLHVFFDDDSDGRVQFGERLDNDANGIFETPVDDDQNVFVDGDILFVAVPLDEPNDPNDSSDGDAIADLTTALTGAADLDAVDDVLHDADAGAGRDRLSPIATIGKAVGNLAFRSTNGGKFIMSSGERLAVGGNLTIDHAGEVVTIGDAAASGAAGIRVIASEIGLVKRNAGVTFLADGSSTQDGGSSILANLIDFGGVTPMAIGVGKQPIFGVPDPFDPTLPAFLSGFPVAEITAGGGALDPSAFTFVGNANLDQVASPIAQGGSRSELTGAIPPLEAPIRAPVWRALAPLENAERMTELGVDARETDPAILLERLEGTAIIDDLGLVATSSNVPVTESRLNPKDAEQAIALYESLFGPDGESALAVQATLQGALDRYLQTTRARRVVGFELRRFIRNRPSTLLEAYTTLDQLDALFRYHRRLGLSRGEYRQIQRGWLEAIQPEGISLDELSEAIHPSRYVRGSDILDIFGR